MTAKRIILPASLLCGFAFVSACSAQQKYPPPVYQQPELPAWQPPEREPDPLDSLELDGEWVEEPPPEPVAPVESTIPHAGDTSPIEVESPSSPPEENGPSADEPGVVAP